jgi:hypothetical protein
MPQPLGIAVAAYRDVTGRETQKICFQISEQIHPWTLASTRNPNRELCELKRNSRKLPFTVLLRGGAEVCPDPAAQILVANHRGEIDKSKRREAGRADPE